MQTSQESLGVLPNDQEVMLWLDSQRPDILEYVNNKLDDLFQQNQSTPFQRKEITKFSYFFVACFPKDREFFDVFVEELLKHTDEQELLIYSRFLKTCIQEATMIGFDSTRFAYGIREDTKHQTLTQKPLYAVSNMLHLKIYIADILTQQTPEKLDVMDVVEKIIALLRSAIEVLVQTNEQTMSASQQEMNGMLQQAIDLEGRLSQIDTVPRLPWIYILIKTATTLLDNAVDRKADIIAEERDLLIKDIQKTARLYADARIPLQNQLFGNRPVHIGSGVATRLPPLYLGSEYTRQNTYNPIPIPDEEIMKNMDAIVQLASYIGRPLHTSRKDGLAAILPAFKPKQMNNGSITCEFLEEFKKEVEANEKAFGLTLNELQVLLEWEWRAYPSKIE